MDFTYYYNVINIFGILLQINLDLRNCDLRKIVPTTKILVHKLFDLSYDFLSPHIRFKKNIFPIIEKKYAIF